MAYIVGLKSLGKIKPSTTGVTKKISFHEDIWKCAVQLQSQCFSNMDETMPLFQIKDNSKSRHLLNILSYAVSIEKKGEGTRNIWFFQVILLTIYNLNIALPEYISENYQNHIQYHTNTKHVRNLLILKSLVWLLFWAIKS